MSAPPMRVLVQGPGAIGRLIAARFHRAGIAVELLGRREPGERTIALHEGKSPEAAHLATLVVHSVAAGTPPRRGDPADAWIITTKAYDVREALAAGTAHVRPGAPVLILSNGLGHDETLAELAGVRPALLGTIACGARAEGDQIVRALGEGPVRIGPCPGAGAGAGAASAAAALGGLFRLAGFAAEEVPDGRSAQWAKGALNCGLNPVAALLGVPNGEVPHTHYFRWAVEAAREAAGLARATGLDLPERGWRNRLALLCEATAVNRCSMLQDLEAGRPLEIDHLNGWVAVRAPRHHVPAPRNRRFAEVLSSESSRQLLELQRFVRAGGDAPGR